MGSEVASKFGSKHGAWKMDEESAREQLWGGGPRDPRSSIMIIIGNH